MLLYKLLIDFGLELEAVEQDSELKLQIIGLANERILRVLISVMLRLVLLLRRIYVEKEVR